MGIPNADPVLPTGPSATLSQWHLKVWTLDLAIPGVNSPKFATFKVGVKSVKTQNRCNFHLELSHRGFRAAAVDGVRRPLPHLKKKKKKKKKKIPIMFYIFFWLGAGSMSARY